MLFKENISVFPRLLIVLLLVISTGCATYYQRNLQFQEAFAVGNLDKANKLLDKNKKAAEDRNRLLYFMQKGAVLQLQGQYELSNQMLEQAYIYTEDYKKNYGYEALVLVSNPMMRPYTGEDHEKVLIHYYKALNYLMLAKPQEALVEARRLNNKLNVLNDKYGDRKNRYSDDAFAHILMGIAYEMDNDINNAFIAYRNAYESYKTNYLPEFGVKAPDQLKKDLLRTASAMGFIDELQQYEKEFGMKYNAENGHKPELIFFWHNGLGPVKSEWSMNFTVVKGQGGTATFVNEEMGLNFPFPLPDNGKPNGGLGDLKLVRVAFPKYETRKPIFNSASLSVNGNSFPLEKAEDINEIAYSILQDRMMRELGSSLLRLATKQAAEYALRQENQDAGALLSIVNALTEKADTRNWQTLPYSVWYSRVPLKAGSNSVTLKTQGPSANASGEQVFNFEVEEGQTIFQIYHSLESLPPGY